MKSRKLARTRAPSAREAAAMSNTDFDHAAWVAEYEAIGGRVCVVEQRDGEQALGLTYPPRPGRPRQRDAW
jgi:hypothetical protein